MNAPYQPERPRLAAVRRGQWTVEQLRQHLQYAVDLELWTIPYYLAARFSIKDRASEAAQLIRTVANQEMLHLQLAANLANAFGATVVVQPPVYGQGIPHLDFALDQPDPTRIFAPWSSDLGPLDATRLNTMCLIEYPDWDGGVDPDPRAIEYGSIGDFYHSVAIGAEELRRHIVGNRRQLDVFSNFYPEFAHPTVTRDGEYGWPQVQGLMNAILTQGEGKLDRRMPEERRARVLPWLRIFNGHVPGEFQNQADDLRPQSDHFEKFSYLLRQPLPEVWTAAAEPSPAGVHAQERLRRNFAHLCRILQDEMQGEPGEFSPTMFQIGSDIESCWRNGAVPVFS